VTIDDYFGSDASRQLYNAISDEQLKDKSKSWEHLFIGGGEICSKNRKRKRTGLNVPVNKRHKKTEDM